MSGKLFGLPAIFCWQKKAPQEALFFAFQKKGREGKKLVTVSRKKLLI